MGNSFVEKTLEQIIFDNKEAVTKNGFPDILENLSRQYRLSSGGIIDLYAFELAGDQIFIQIFELKRNYLDFCALCQITKYAHCLVGELLNDFKVVTAKLILVGQDVDPNVIILADWGLDVQFVLYKYGLSGLTFKQLNAGGSTSYFGNVEDLEKANLQPQDL